MNNEPEASMLPQSSVWASWVIWQWQYRCSQPQSQAISLRVYPILLVLING